MSRFSEYIGSQFSNPRGLPGVISCLCMNVINRTMYQKIASLLGISRGAKVLDIGYGNGYLLRYIDKIYKPELYGIDLSEDMQNLAIQKNKSAQGEGRLHLSVGDCCELPYGDESFVAVTSVNTVYFWKDTKKGLQEIKRCLRPGGCFYNVLYTKEWLDKLSYTEKGFKKFEAEQLVQLGYEAGFQNVRVQEIKKGKSFVVIYKKPEKTTAPKGDLQV